jgi:hypothetical protein
VQTLQAIVSLAYQFAVQSPKRLRKLVIISATYKSNGYLPIVNTAFEDFKPEFFDNTPLKPHTMQ